MQGEMQKQINELIRKVEELEARLTNVDKQGIKIVADFDGTNIPVTVNGVRRKIATTAP